MTTAMISLTSSAVYRLGESNCPSVPRRKYTYSLSISSRQCGQDWYSGLATDLTIQTCASLISTRGTNVYAYFFEHSPSITSSLTSANDQGTYHSAEQLYVFNNIPYNYPDAGWMPADYVVQEQMVQYWVNFGNPNGDGSATGNLPASGNDEKVTCLGDSWGAEPIAIEAKKSFVLDWFAATGYHY